MNFFQHKMGIAALFRGRRVPGDRHLLLFNRLQIDIIKMNLVLCQLGDLHISNIIDGSRPVQDRRYIGCDQVFIDAFSDDQRTVLPHREHPIRIVFKQDPKRIGAPHPEHGPGNRFQRSSRLFIVIIDQLNRHFRIRSSIKLIAFF